MTTLRERPWEPRDDPPELVFTNVSLVDSKAGAIIPNCNVRVSRGLVTDVSSTSSASHKSLADNVHTINLEGKYLCPGLIDCHVHLSATPGSLSLKDLFSIHPNTVAYRTTYVAKQMLLRGFTTARDTGGADASLRSAIAEGLLPGPRLFIAGKALSQTGGHGDFRASHEGDEYKCCGGHAPSLARVCDGVPQCLAAARDELRQGADFLKIMCGGGVVTPSDPLDMLQFTAEEIRAITTTAGHSNTYVTAHAYTSKAIRHAVENGVMGIEHGNFIDAETAKFCAEKGIIFTPTLVTYHGMTQKPFDSFLSATGKDKNQQVLASGFESLRILKDANITMCYGSDLLSGLHVLQNGEFSLRANVLNAVEILQSATTNAAKLLRMEGKLGCISKGAIADMLILNQNPLEDISVLDRVEETLLVIIKDGRVVKSKIKTLDINPLYRSFS